MEEIPIVPSNITNGDVYRNDITFGKRLETIDLKDRFLNVDWFLCSVCP